MYSAVINQVQVHNQRTIGFKSKLFVLDPVTRCDLKQNWEESKETQQSIQEERGRIQFIPYRPFGFPVSIAGEFQCVLFFL